MDTKTVRGFGFLVTARGIGSDQKARISACRRTFKRDGWTYLRTVDANSVIVSASTLTGGAPTVFTARGVSVQALGAIDVEWTFADNVSALSLGRGQSVRVHAGTPALVEQ